MTISREQAKAAKKQFLADAAGEAGILGVDIVQEGASFRLEVRLQDGVTQDAILAGKAPTAVEDVTVVYMPGGAA